MKFIKKLVTLYFAITIIMSFAVPTLAQNADLKSYVSIYKQGWAKISITPNLRTINKRRGANAYLVQNVKIGDCEKIYASSVNVLKMNNTCLTFVPLNGKTKTVTVSIPVKYTRNILYQKE